MPKGTTPPLFPPLTSGGLREADCLPYGVSMLFGVVGGEIPILGEMSHSDKGLRPAKGLPSRFVCIFYFRDVVGSIPYKPTF